MIASAIRLSLCVPQPLFAFSQSTMSTATGLRTVRAREYQRYQATDQYNATNSQDPGSSLYQWDILDGLRVVRPALTVFEK